MEQCFFRISWKEALDETLFGCKYPVMLSPFTISWILNLSCGHVSGSFRFIADEVLTWLYYLILLLSNRGHIRIMSLSCRVVHYWFTRTDSFRETSETIPMGIALANEYDTSVKILTMRPSPL